MVSSAIYHIDQVTKSSTCLYSMKTIFAHFLLTCKTDFVVTVWAVVYIAHLLFWNIDFTNWTNISAQIGLPVFLNMFVYTFNWRFGVSQILRPKFWIRWLIYICISHNRKSSRCLTSLKLIMVIAILLMQ